MPISDASLVCDLGCGPGNVTRVIAERFAGARVAGIDISSEMLAKAAATPSRIEWIQADVAQWEPDQASALDVWETEYHQRLEGDDPVLEWVKATALRPVLNGLHGAERERFVEVYRERLRRAYPRRAGGHVLYLFRRLFMVATRRG